ncbi:MAG: 4-alpha-glucanotransferase [Ruminococcaceae bacterium]|nr:4-alpha-glucanotransferase [Oscillospiraceae bacterium]
MLNKRGAGVLMHISTIPSDYGIGVFDENCRYFVDKLQSMNFGYWQVLPFNPVDKANSPYCSASAFAGNILFIDPKALYEDGLCTKEDYEENIYHGSPYTADYEFASEKRLKLLRKAFLNINAETAQKIKDFDKENTWLSDFSLFMALKDKYNDAPWWEWDEKYAHFSSADASRGEFEEECAFWKFTQYLFYKQWNAVKTYANSKGIAIIGDMPIYVAMDSCDVWANVSQFMIDKETLKPKKVAGCPPDYFSEDGQLWGNPLYNWDYMEKDGFKWWLSRISQSLKTYDCVRIDHFRAFASYWEIPADSDTAKNGAWAKGPGMKLFDKVKEAFGELPIIAEDLGTFGEDVIKLLSDTGFPGMKVVQFGFDPDADSLHLPHNTVINSVNYCGTHDNNTLLGWLWEASEKERAFALEYIGFTGQNWGDGGYKSESCRKIIESVWKSSSNTAIIAFQDMCGFGSDARMNIPGVPEKNWRYRTTKETIDNVDFDYFRKLNSVFRRTYPVFEK